MQSVSTGPALDQSCVLNLACDILPQGSEADLEENSGFFEL